VNSFVTALFKVERNHRFQRVMQTIGCRCNSLELYNYAEEDEEAMEESEEEESSG